jgi:hypothetical protein
MKTTAILLIISLSTWFGIALYLWFLHRKIILLEKKYDK